MRMQAEMEEWEVQEELAVQAVQEV